MPEKDVHFHKQINTQILLVRSFSSSLNFLSFSQTSQLEEEKDNGFITKIESGDWEGAREMIKLLSVDQETLILGLSCLSKPSLLDFLQVFIWF